MVVRGEAEVHGGLSLADLRDECDGTVVVDSEIDPTVGRLHELAAVHGGEFERLHRHDALRRGRRYMNLRSRGFFGGERTSRCLLWSSGLASMIPTASEACARHSLQRNSYESRHRSTTSSAIRASFA